jgi:ATP-dependent Zn protease
MTKIRRDLTAYHEAGHAVVSRVLGIEVVTVVMFGLDDISSAGVLNYSASCRAGANTAERIVGLETDTRISLAGLIAGELYGKCSRRRLRDDAAGDIQISQSRAVEIALLIAGKPLPQHHDNMTVELDRAAIDSANAIINRLRAETETLLKEHWPKVERVAQALMTCDMLDQARLDRIMAGGS